MSGGFDNGVFDTAVFDESSKTISLILAKPFNESASWMTYIAISGSDATPEGFLLDEFYRKLGTVKVVRNTYFISATFGQDEPGKEGYFDRGVFGTTVFDEVSETRVIKSVGIYDQSVGGVLGEWWVLDGDGIDKDNIDEIVIECAVTMLHNPGS